MFLFTIFFATFLYSAASAFSSCEYSKQNLDTYHHKLLNEDLLPFLNLCYSKNCCSKNDDILCPSYFELVRLLSTKVNSNITTQELKTVEKSASKINVENFCANFSKSIPTTLVCKSNKTQNEITNLVIDSNACRLLCVEINFQETTNPSLTIKPLCSFISWMSKKLSDNTRENLIKNQKEVNSLPASVLNTTVFPKTNINNVPNTKTVSSTLADNLLDTENNNGKLPKSSIPENEKLKNKTENQDQQQNVTPNLDEEQTDELASYKYKQDVDMYNDGDTDEDKITNTFESNLIPKIVAPIANKKNDSNLILSDPFYEEAGSNFFIYFLIGMFFCVMSYVIYHNKSKILALVIEGRSQKMKSRRKHLAGYRKLDTNLEEAITSTSSGQFSQIIY